MPKLKKQIQDSKLKRDFKKREKIRAAKQRSKKESVVRHQKQKSKDFVQKVKTEKESKANTERLSKLLDEAPDDLEAQVLQTLKRHT